MSDDHAQWGVGAYGTDGVSTPTLDYLAERGVRMENAFCPTPVCSPARASFFTGQRASQHGIHDWLSSSVDDHPNWLDGETTLPQLLSEAGYTTALVGKWHCGHDNVEQHFDHVATLRGEEYDFHHFSAERDRKVTDEAIAFIREHVNSSEPFFLFVGLANTHLPLNEGPERLVDRYRTSDFPDLPESEHYRFGRNNRTRSGEDRQLTRAQYYATIQSVDEQVGRLVDELTDLDTFGETLFAYTSDHGYNVGHHGIWGKGNGSIPQNVLEESIRVPLIFAGHDDLATGQNRSEFVDHCDTFQTVLEFASVEPPADVFYPGSSYFSGLTRADNSLDREQRQVCEYANVRMIRDERHKIVRIHPDGQQISETKELLFDLEADPRETENRREWPEYETVVGRLGAELDAEFEQYSEAGNEGIYLDKLPTYNHNQAWER
jgi:arylsulfatase A-like enzyme